MFAKLLKMEFRSTWNILGILCLSLVGAGLLGGLATRYLVNADAVEGWPGVLCILTVVAVVLFFAVCAAAALILQIVRFYRSRFTDEGYLTFTLPVGTHQILLSSLVSSAVNLIAVAAVALVSLALMGLCAIPSMEILKQGLSLIRQSLPAIWERVLQTEFLQALGLFLANAVANFASELVLVMLAVTIGSLAAKKHKILAAVAFYYILHIAMYTVSGIALAHLADTPEGVFGFWTVANLVIAVVGYFAAYWLVDRKLNLN